MTWHFKTFNINSTTPKRKKIIIIKNQKADSLPAFKCISLLSHGEKLADYKSNVKDSAGNEVACCASVCVYIYIYIYN